MDPQARILEGSRSTGKDREVAVLQRQPPLCWREQGPPLQGRHESHASGDTTDRLNWIRGFVGCLAWEGQNREEREEVEC